MSTTIITHYVIIKRVGFCTLGRVLKILKISLKVIAKLLYSIALFSGHIIIFIYFRVFLIKGKKTIGYIL